MRPIKTFLLACGIFLLAFSATTASVGAREWRAPEGHWTGTYIVKHGDSLSGIAFWAYGNAGAWKCIWEANPWIGNPNRIQAGWDIYLPPDCSGHKGGGGDDYDHPKAGGGDDYDHPKAGGGGDDYDHPKAGGGGDDYDHPKGGGGYGGYHIVRHGETLWGIACSYYSDCGYWRIYNANRHLIAYPGHIQVGWKLYIP